MDDTRWTVQHPTCALCAGHDEPAVCHHLTHGIHVWLCTRHRGISYQTRNGGVDFVNALGTLWAAAGRLTARHRAALDTHIRRLRPAPTTRNRPGSYSWPRLRAEAERRFKNGEPPGAVIAELRERNVDELATTPSKRTMYRWFTEARWLATTLVHRILPDPRPPTRPHPAPLTWAWYAQIYPWPQPRPGTTRKRSP